MTVNDLIKELQTYPQDAEVIFNATRYEYGYYEDDGYFDGDYVTDSFTYFDVWYDGDYVILSAEN